MTLLMERPGSTISDLCEEPDGPQDVEIMILGYESCEGARYPDFHLAINEAGASHGFGNTLSLVQVTTPSKSFKSAMRSMYSHDPGYFLREKKIEGGRVVCGPEELELRQKLWDESHKGTWYIGKVYECGSQVGYYEEIARDRPLPVKRVRKAALEERIGQDTGALPGFESKLREGRLSEREFTRLMQVSLERNNDVATSLGGYFLELFGDELEGWRSFKWCEPDLGWQNLFPLDFLLSPNGFSLQRQMAPIHKVNDKLFWYGSYREFKQVADKGLSVQEDVLGEASSDLVRSVRGYVGRRALDKSRENTWWGCLPILAGLTSAPAAALSYWADWDYGWIVPGVFAADMLTRSLVKKVSGRPGAPGIIGLARSLYQAILPGKKRD